MNPVYIYPGSFCPPTYGHVQMVEKSAEIFDHVTVICSINSDKVDNWFTPIECKKLWLTYDLPENVSVKTFDEFTSTGVSMSDIVMIRGVRDDNDFEHEKKVLFLNNNQFGIDKYFYVVSEEKYRHISSSAVRKLATNIELEKLAEYVSPLIISTLLEHVLEVNKIFLVVGRPGSGKSTFLKMIVKDNLDFVHINTDEFNHQLKPLLRKVFPKENLVQLALEREDELKAVIVKDWFKLLRESLKKAKKQSCIFVEIAYGLQADKNMFRFIGGRIVYIGCGNEEKCRRRIIDRGTPDSIKFFDQIPGVDETIRICEDHDLNLKRVETNIHLMELKKEALRFVEAIKEED